MTSPRMDTRRKVGRVVVTCPACGEALEGLVQVGMVSLTNQGLVVTFGNAVIDHECPGRD